MVIICAKYHIMVKQVITLYDYGIISRDKMDLYDTWQFLRKGAKINGQCEVGDYFL